MSMLRLVLALVIVLSVGCTRGPAPEHLAAADSAAPAPPTASARPLPEAKLKAIARCKDGFEAVAHAGSALGHVAVACADLYPRSPCHEAWRDFGNQSDATTLATACSRAYCSLLAAPVPTLCQPGHVMPSGGELQPLWIELDTAIIAYELNLDREAASQASVARILGQMMAPVRVALPAGAPDNADNPDVVIQIRKRDSGIEIRIDAAGRKWALSAQPTPAELAPMVAAVKATGLEQPVIVLEPAADVSHAVVVGIVEALKRAHFSRLAIATAEKEK